MNSLYTEAAKRIVAAKRILLITHISPDGDALGSLCFMSEWLSSLDISHTLYCAGPLPENLSFLPHFDQITTDKTKVSIDQFDLVISLDCGSLARTALASEIKDRPAFSFFIEIDHHPSVEKVSDLEIREPKAASTTEVLYHIAQANKICLNSRMAHCLLTGVLTDTGSFRFASTSEKTIAAASQMLLEGASLSKIIDKTWRTKNVKDLRLWGLALSRLQKSPVYNVAYTILTQEDLIKTESDEEAIEGLPEFISSLPNTRAILLLREDNQGAIRGNWRTLYNEIDVGRLARLLGGGGHQKAAGFTIPGRLVQTEKGWKVES